MRKLRHRNTRRKAADASTNQSPKNKTLGRREGRSRTKRYRRAHQTVARKNGQRRRSVRQRRGRRGGGHLPPSDTNGPWPSPLPEVGLDEHPPSPNHFSSYNGSPEDDHYLPQYQQPAAHSQGWAENQWYPQNAYEDESTQNIDANYESADEGADEIYNGVRYEDFDEYQYVDDDRYENFDQDKVFNFWLDYCDRTFPDFETFYRDHADMLVNYPPYRSWLKFERCRQR
jgi:hypothetical protein